MPKRTNDGLRKVCGCPRRQWAKCAHPWHVNFCRGKDAAGRKIEYRFSLHRFADKARSYVMAKTEAEELRDRARAEIRAGRLSPKGERIAPPAIAERTLDDVAAEYLQRYVRVPSRRPAALEKFERHVDQLTGGRVIRSSAGPVRLGDLPFQEITRADLDALFDTRAARAKDSADALGELRRLEAAGQTVNSALRDRAGLALRSPKGGQVGLNRFKARVRHLFNWAIAQGYRDDTPFKRHGVTVIRQDHGAETERTRRLLPDDEDRLLAAASTHLRALIVAALSTGCRLGELLGLQWHQVKGDDRGALKYITLPPDRTKTGEPRVLPIGPRLRAVLEMRRTDPLGAALPSTAYVFGNDVGEQNVSIREAWSRACAKAGLTDLHFHDLRREFACRLLESRAELHDVRDFLGHANITTTSRYLRSTPLRLERALGLLEAVEAQRIRKPFAKTDDGAAPSVPAPADAQTESSRDVTKN